MSQKTKQKINLEITQEEIEKGNILEQYLTSHHIVKTTEYKKQVEIVKYSLDGRLYLFYKFRPYTTFGWHDLNNLEEKGFGFLSLYVGLGNDDIEITMDLRGKKQK